MRQLWLKFLKLQAEQERGDDPLANPAWESITSAVFSPFVPALPLPATLTSFFRTGNTVHPCQDKHCFSEESLDTNLQMNCVCCSFQPCNNLFDTLWIYCVPLHKFIYKFWWIYYFCLLMDTVDVPFVKRDWWRCIKSTIGIHAKRHLAPKSNSGFWVHEWANSSAFCILHLSSIFTCLIFQKHSGKKMVEIQINQWVQ